MWNLKLIVALVPWASRMSTELPVVDLERKFIPPALQVLVELNMRFMDVKEPDKYQG